jgi:uncharacterized protein (TIGR00255 family)
MRSMTGFGKGEARNIAAGIAFTVEISAVNRKQLEIRANLPREVSAFEPILRNCVSDKVSRGSLQVRVTLSLDENSEMEMVKVNSALLERLARNCAELQKKMGVPVDTSIPQLMALPGVVEPASPDIDRPEIKEVFKEAVQKAVEALVAMREYEGEALKADLAERQNKLAELVEAIEPLAEGIPGHMKQKLLERLEKENLPIDASDERVLKEVVIYADKSDVTEELTRLRSHFQQFQSFLDKKEPVGRSMDFLMQEMFREITTLGNKAGGCEITPRVVEFKTELEKIREQVQNIE